MKALNVIFAIVALATTAHADVYGTCELVSGTGKSLVNAPSAFSINQVNSGELLVQKGKKILSYSTANKKLTDLSNSSSIFVQSRTDTENGVLLETYTLQADQCDGPTPARALYTWNIEQNKPQDNGIAEYDCSCSND